MQNFSFGFLSLLLDLSFPALYVVARQFRRFGSWVQREVGPKERVGAIVAIMVIFGFGAVALLSPLGTKARSARHWVSRLRLVSFFHNSHT